MRDYLSRTLIQHQQDMVGMEAEAKKELVKSLKQSLQKIDIKLSVTDDGKEKDRLMLIRSNTEKLLMDNLSEFQSNAWIIPCSNIPEISISLEDNGYVLIESTKPLDKASKGDAAYIYTESITYCGIRYKCVIEDTGINTEQNDAKYIKLRYLHGYNGKTDVSYGKLKLIGLKSKLDSPVKLSHNIRNYLEACDKMQY